MTEKKLITQLHPQDLSSSQLQRIASIMTEFNVNAPITVDTGDPECFLEIDGHYIATYQKDDPYKTMYFLDAWSINPAQKMFKLIEFLLTENIIEVQDIENNKLTTQ